MRPPTDVGFVADGNGRSIASNRVCALKSFHPELAPRTCLLDKASLGLRNRPSGDRLWNNAHWGMPGPRKSRGRIYETENATFSRVRGDFDLTGVSDDDGHLEWSVLERIDCQGSAGPDRGVTVNHRRLQW